MQENKYRSWQKRRFAQGETGTNSKRPCNFPATFPAALTHGNGIHVYDTDGKKYVDFINGLGANLLGYNHPKVEEAADQIMGPTLSLPTRLEMEVAEKVIERFPQIQKLRFLKTGSEACSAANRIMNAHFKRNMNTSGYHGWHDVFQQGIEPGHGLNITWPYAPDNLQDEYHFIEPLELKFTDERKEEIKDLKPVVFDEVISGCRVEGYSVGQFWQLDPDITCLGKALGNGYPISVVGGKKEVMDSCEYFVSSTFSGEMKSLAAAGAVLDFLATQDMKQFQYYGQRLQDKLNNLHPEMKWEGYGTRSQFNLFESEFSAKFSQEMARAGYLFGRAFFYTFAMMEQENFEDILFNTAVDVVNKIQMDQVKLITMPKPTFKR